MFIIFHAYGTFFSIMFIFYQYPMPTASQKRSRSDQISVVGKSKPFQSRKDEILAPIFFHFYKHDVVGLMTMTLHKTYSRVHLKLSRFCKFRDN